VIRILGAFLETGRSAPHFLQNLPFSSLFIAPQFVQIIIFTIFDSEINFKQEIYDYNNNANIVLLIFFPPSYNYQDVL
jgi:hypothetical protein